MRGGRIPRAVRRMSQSSDKGQRRKRELEAKKAKVNEGILEPMVPEVGTGSRVWLGQRWVELPRTV